MAEEFVTITLLRDVHALGLCKATLPSALLADHKKKEILQEAPDDQLSNDETRTAAGHMFMYELDDGVARDRCVAKAADVPQGASFNLWDAHANIAATAFALNRLNCVVVQTIFMTQEMVLEGQLSSCSRPLSRSLAF